MITTFSPKRKSKKADPESSAARRLLRARSDQEWASILRENLPPHLARRIAPLVWWDFCFRNKPSDEMEALMSGENHWNVTANEARDALLKVGYSQRMEGVRIFSTAWLCREPEPLEQ